MFSVSLLLKFHRGNDEKNSEKVFGLCNNETQV